MPVQRSSTHQPHDLPTTPVRDAVRPVPAVGRPPGRTRTGSAWVGVCVGALVLVALVVFMLQNTSPVEVSFLAMTGTAPLALVMLVAGLGVGVVALVIGSLRIGQLRRRIRAARSTGTTPHRPTL
ncbi:LapA family protein [Cellulomonas sp. P4]|uniref:LapA family protein n=1 Tax=Cellulomonas sp. P4 TaxID=3142533 RepID=UPI0031BB2961